MRLLSSFLLIIATGAFVASLFSWLPWAVAQPVIWFSVGAIFLLKAKADRDKGQKSWMWWDLVIAVFDFAAAAVNLLAA